MIKWIVLFLIIFSFGSISAETDGFTARYKPVEDALPKINQEVNSRIEAVIQQMNRNIKTKHFCDWNELNSLLGEQLRRPLVGQIETFISFSKSIPKSIVDFEQSIYKDIPAPENIPLKVGAIIGVGFTPQIHHNGLLIGADKFGHFLDEGYYYYFLIHHWDYQLEEVLDFGTFTENNFYGKLIGGIYSYADLAANYEGYRFWNDMLGAPKEREKSKYFSCENKNWSIKDTINFDHYINPAWDEGMNCNDFRSEKMFKGLNRSIKELENRSHRRYNCPVYPERVAEMINRYGKLANKLIHPNLFKLHK